MKPLVSVILPTFNRSDVLERTIRAYLDQSRGSNPFEIIVVDDGSTDETGQILKRLSAGSAGVLQVHRQDNRGPAAARNAGIRMAEGAIILFAGDDVIPTENLLEQHLLTHRLYPSTSIAVLGHITWSPEQHITPFMKWLETGGVQFNYGAIRDPENVSAEQFYSSNLSLPKDFLLEGDLFDERFTDACWEDIDLGMRLVKRGLKIVYNKEALGFHLHPTDFRRYRSRTRRAGYFEGFYNSKHMKPVKRSGGGTLLLKFVVGTVLRFSTVGVLREQGYRWSLQWFSWLGMNEYLRKGIARSS